MGSPKKRIQYRYDSVGNRIGMTDPDGGRFTYAYDAVNRITQVINPQGDRTSYAYDAGGRRTVKKLANGTRASFSYDAASNLTRLANLKSDGTTISSFNYDYDRVGNRTAVLEADGSRVTWSYDDTYQLTGEHRTGTTPYEDSYSYDAAGNRLLKIHDGARTTYSYDAANQLEWSEDASGRTTYTFDADGNQQLVVEPSGDRTTTTWDYENRTTLVHLSSGIRNTMAYEPGGLRVKLEESTGTKKFVWDEQNYLAETDENDDTQVVYTNEPRLYGNLVSQRRGTDSHWYQFDGLDSTREITDAGESVSGSHIYDTWGQKITSQGVESPFRYVGRAGYYFDSTTDQYYVRARLYNTAIGRWSSVDPLSLVISSPCLYQYAGNAPSLTSDPSGLLIRDFDPPANAIVGMAWCDVGVATQLDPEGGVAEPSIAGDTLDVVYSISCACQCCNSATCQFQLECIVQAYLQIRINRYAHMVKEEIYGHEQRHVRNLLRGAELWAQEAANREREVGCGPLEECRRAKDELEFVGNNALKNWLLRESQHGLGDPQEDQGYWPLPTEAGPTGGPFPKNSDCTKPGTPGTPPKFAPCPAFVWIGVSALPL